MTLLLMGDGNGCTGYGFGVLLVLANILGSDDSRRNVSGEHDNENSLPFVPFHS